MCIRDRFLFVQPQNLKPYLKTVQSYGFLKYVHKIDVLRINKGEFVSIGHYSFLYWIQVLPFPYDTGFSYRLCIQWHTRICGDILIRYYLVVCSYLYRHTDLGLYIVCFLVKLEWIDFGSLSFKSIQLWILFVATCNYTIGSSCLKMLIKKDCSRSMTAFGTYKGA